MAIGDFEQVSRIIPNPAGTGNKVFLRSLPEYDSESAYPKVVFPLVDGEGSEYLHGQLDPYNATTVEIKKGGWSRLIHLYGALMTDENYQLLKNFDEKLHDNLGPFVEFANGLLAEDVLETEITALIAYNKSGYLTMPVVGAVFSTKYKPKTLQWNPASKTTLKPVQKESDSEGDTGANDM